MTSPTPKPATVVIADDAVANLELYTRVLTREGYRVVGARDGAAALERVHEVSPDIVLSDVFMPGVDGFALCRRLKADRSTRLIPVVLVTANGDRERRLEGIDAGADDFLTKPVDTHELRARVRSLVRLKRFTDDLDSAESVILSLGLTVEARDPYTAGHCQRMATYAAAFGVHLGLSDDELMALHRGGYLHDVGKIGVPDAILLKPGELTDDEFRTMTRHTVIGENLCGAMKSLQMVRPIVRHHHERLDGSGYPDGIAGDAIPLLAQIMGIVDVYDALTTDRVYRRALNVGDACAALQSEVARGWRRRDLVDAFVDLSLRNGLAHPGAGHDAALPQPSVDTGTERPAGTDTPVLPLPWRSRAD